MRSIARRKGVVILRSELAGLGSPAQLSRVLVTLVKNGKLVRVGRGVYAKTRVNRFTGGPAPAAVFEAIASEAFRKLGIDIAPGTLLSEYNAGKSTQVPMTPVVSTGTRRISRRIQVGRKVVIYERGSKLR
ncbi:DUF6088 family protein [Paraburkholderia sediminicola]|uniref:DUF6088 family protein n=1 Tax=Paraburkholderia sediminicola TaxID=458836 RepID=UPI0038BAC422